MQSFSSIEIPLCGARSRLPRPTKSHFKKDMHALSFPVALFKVGLKSVPEGNCPTIISQGIFDKRMRGNTWGM